MGNSNNSVTITGSTVGAFAIGSGATASNVRGEADPNDKFSFEFKSKGATRAQIAKWLRSVADIVADPEHPTMSHATTVDGASRAWTIEAEKKNA